MSACTKFVRNVLNDSLKLCGHDATIYGSVNTPNSIISAKPGFIHLRFIVDKHNLNRQGTLNGGCQTSLVDSVGSLVVATHGLFKTGVSTDISTTFCKPIPYNEPVDIFGYIASIGKTMAYTKVEFCHPDTGKLLAYGSHTKYIANSINSKENVKFSEDGEHLM